MSAALKPPLDKPRDLLQQSPGAPKSYRGRAACAELGWHVVEADEPRVTQQAAQWLESKGFETFRPLFPVWRQVTRHGKQDSHRTWHFEPRFYQFIFARFALDEPWQRIRSEPANGIRRLLISTGQTPLRVADDLIEWFRLDENHRRAEIEAQERRRMRMAPLKTGAIVMVRTAPIGVDEYGHDRYHHLAGAVVEVEICDGRVTTAWVTMFGGRRIPARFARSELVDE